MNIGQLLLFSTLVYFACEINYAKDIINNPQETRPDNNLCYKAPVKCSEGNFFQNRGIFLSITNETFDSAKNIIEGLINISTKLTINIIVHQKELLDHNLAKSMATLTNRLQSKNIKFNTIKLTSDSESPIYLRDLTLFNILENQVESLTVPYFRNDVIGPSIVKEISSQCGFNFHTSFAHKSNKFQDTINQWSEDQRTYLMGGNFLQGPNQTLFVGSTPSTPFDNLIFNYFSKKFKTLKVMLPEQEVGHIDEIFQFINDPHSKCNFAILKASPLKALEFLSLRSKNEIITGTNNPDFLISNEHITAKDIFFHTTITSHNKDLSQMKINGEKISKYELNKLEHSLKKKLKYDQNKNLTTGELLNNHELVQKWHETETTINKSLEEIISFIDKTLKKKCEAKIISLPVFFTSKGETWFPNPVNGEEIEGHYFYSKQTKAIYRNKIFWDADLGQFSLGPRRELYKGLNSYIDKIIQNHTQLIPQAIDTANYDSGQGNFHCATNTIKEICLI